MRTFAYGVLCLAGATQASEVTPMEKVIGLLKSLSAKVAEEGKKEAAAYDKFACFCKEQADEKLYNIEKSTAKIEDLSAQIGELNSAIADLNQDISKLSKLISDRESEIDKKTKKRKKERAEYEAKAKDMNEAIDACGAAIDALKGSKDDMDDAKVDFAQIKKVAAAVAKQPLLSSAPGAAALLSMSDQQAPKFEYQSNDIIATLESLLATFKSMKKDLDFEEHDINAAFESTVLGLSNEKKFAEKDRSEKQAIVESKTEELEGAKVDKGEETNDKDADDAFMKELTSECEQTALLFDQRSKTRADELSTLAEATAELQKGAVPNYGANKNLVDFQKKAVVQKAKLSVSAPAFVQINKVDHKAGKAAMIQKILDMLHGAAGRTKSTALAAVGMKIKVAEDHFVKVRALIKDLIAKLKADAKAEATTKSFCDKGMKKAVTERDDSNARIEVATSKITTLTATKNELTSTIETLQADIAELKKGLLERTELRNEEKEDNAQTVAESQEAIESVKLALSLLKGFYNKAGFVQTSSQYVPPKSDRSGNTVGDLAPEVFDSKYSGSQSESKGILGILEVILSDFQRTKKTTKANDADSKKEFEKFEKETNADIKEKQKKIKTAEGDLTDAKENILKQQGKLSDAKDLFESATNKLDDLKAMCVDGEETWEERKKKREEEIEALKQALQTLEDWQSSQ